MKCESAVFVVGIFSSFLGRVVGFIAAGIGFRRGLSAVIKNEKNKEK